jgi:hypothetical protein
VGSKYQKYHTPTKVNDLSLCSSDPHHNPVTPTPELHTHSLRRNNLLLGLEVVEEDRALLGLLTPILDDNARAVDDLAGVTLTVKGACNELAMCT